jgi:predicted phosphodiesterase
MHGNRGALAAVLRRVRRKRFDAVLVLGDLVGYGAAPNQVVATVRALPGRVVAVRGNHDKVAVGIESGNSFNQVALIAAHWTSRRLTRDHARYVRELPAGPRPVDPGLAICHGSPLDEDKYLFSDQDAAEVFASWRVPVTFFGHTHVTSVFSVGDGWVRVRQLAGARGELEVLPGHRYLINPGSIGQPRDGNPLASFALYDSDSRVVTIHRIEYQVEAAQGKILKAGLPRPLADRLALGR